MAYTPENNPYIPGDPYSYDLKWIVTELKHAIELYTPLSDDFTDLYNYVHDYFDNLDISEEVKDQVLIVIDELKDAGFFDTIIGEIVTDSGTIEATVTAWLTDNVNPVGSAVVVDSSMTISGAAADAQIAGDIMYCFSEPVIDTVPDKITIGFMEGVKWVYGTLVPDTTRLASRHAYYIPGGSVIKINTGADNRVSICLLDDMSFSTWDTVHHYENTNEYQYLTLKTAKYLVVNVSRMNTMQTIHMNQLTSTIEVFKNVGSMPGKNVHVYQYGCHGNDWCFVRTPSNYDPYRAYPYPFVICNHGNGWVMDGTPEKANWTKRTMYVPLDDPDYISDPTEYNGTNNSSLWYSNPTIEALLSAGYIVCGAENYGDGLYGNENCRQACLEFYNHMRANYNVQEGCFMIGASNGAQTSIATAYILGTRVKAMICQYGLTCLINQYNNYSNHRAAIRAAYDINNSSPTQEELIEATKTHDFLHTDIVSGAKIGYFPPTRFYYSPADTVCDYQVNSLAAITALDNGLKIAEGVVCSGEHGDHTHFDPAGYVSFFDTYNRLNN